MFGRDPRDGSRTLVQISTSLPDVPGDASRAAGGGAADRPGRGARRRLALRLVGERRGDPFSRQVERHQRAIARIPAGRDAVLDHELAKAAERQAFEAEVEIERRRLAFEAAPELVI